MIRGSPGFAVCGDQKANELMSHTYSHLYGLPTTGLRFFTVYGPWGRPDMALFKFTKAMIEGNSIDVYNYGKMKRDFTYIDDIVEAIIRLQDVIPQPNPDWTVETVLLRQVPRRTISTTSATAPLLS
jgi:UDP-glucuronate 4-epimerase